MTNSSAVPIGARAAFAAMHAATLTARAVATTGSRLGQRHEPPPLEGPLRVLMLATYPEQFTGTKYRLRMWAKRFESRGFTIDVAPTMYDRHSIRLSNDWSAGARSEFHLRMLLGRLRALQHASAYHTVVIHVNDLPFWDVGPPFVAQSLRRLAGRVVLDLDDLPLVSQQKELNAKARALGGAVDGLIVGNRSLPEKYPGRPWWFVPTCVEPAEWQVPDRSSRTGPPLLGWVGTAGNLRNLEPLSAMLAELCRRHGTKVRIVCSEPARLPGVPEEFVQWSAPREQADVMPLDIGLAPLLDAPKQRYTCGLKALQYMAAGLPVVASPVGAFPSIVRDAQTGLLASTPEEWFHALDRLLTDPGLRLRMGAEGRRDVENRWSFAVHERTFEHGLRGVRPEKQPAVRTSS
ncbi:MAG: glycosyltransferase family 4 protein [Solirubrobacteraceae bacterium]